jgi:hypothetical protein
MKFLNQYSTLRKQSRKHPLRTMAGVAAGAGLTAVAVQMTGKSELRFGSLAVRTDLLTAGTLIGASMLGLGGRLSDDLFHLGIGALALSAGHYSGTLLAKGKPGAKVSGGPWELGAGDDLEAQRRVLRAAGINAGRR